MAGKRSKYRNRGQSQARGQWLRTNKRIAIYERDGWICGGELADGVIYCGEYLAGRPDNEITVDHIIPRSEGGTNHENNLVTCCVNCNSRKGHKQSGQYEQESSVSKRKRNDTLTSEGLTSEGMASDEMASEAAGERDARETVKPEVEPGSIRNRIIEDSLIHSRDLLDHPNNWRTHPAMQRSALSGVLEEIGIAQKLVVYKSERAGGRYVVIDGHLRKDEFQMEWPCVVVDLTDEEADKLLQAHDALGSMAIADRRMMETLRGRIEFNDASVRLMLDKIEDDLNRKSPKSKKNKKGRGEGEGDDGEELSDEDEELIDEMELQPYEHYDYLLVLCRNTLDWNWLCERLGIERKNGCTDRSAPKIGLGRAISGDVFIARLREADDIVEKAAKKMKADAEKAAGQEPAGQAAAGQEPAGQEPSAGHAAAGRRQQPAASQEA